MSERPLVWAFIATLGVLLGLALAWTLLSLSGVLFSVFAATFITLGLDPLVRWFQRRGMKRGVAILTVIILFILVIAGMLWIVLPLVITQAVTFIEQLPQMYANLQQQQWFQDASSGSGGVLGDDLQLGRRRHQRSQHVGDHRRRRAQRRPRDRRRDLDRLLHLHPDDLLHRHARLVEGRDLHAHLRVAPRAGRRLRRAHHAERRPLPQRHGDPRVLQRDLQLHRAAHRAGAVRARDRGRGVLHHAHPADRHGAHHDRDDRARAVRLAAVGASSCSPRCSSTCRWRRTSSRRGSCRKAVQVPGSIVLIAALAGGTLAGLPGALVAIPVAAGILLIIKEVVVPAKARS